MADSIRFSHRPSRADEIGWRAWGPAAFEAAEQVDRPVFLYLTNRWCHSCAAMDAGALSDPAVIIGLFFGMWLDKKLGISPAMMITWLLIGFAAGMRAVFRHVAASDKLAAESQDGES